VKFGQFLFLHALELGMKKKTKQIPAENFTRKIKIYSTNGICEFSVSFLPCLTKVFSVKVC